MRILALSLIVFVASIQSLHSQQTGSAIDLPAGARAVLQAKGNGAQIYTCTGAAGEVKWVLTAPDAKLLDAAGKAIGRHFAGPTWKLDDGSQVQGELIASKPAPESGAIAWLFLRAKAGTGEGRFADITFIRRTETHGGVAPESGCESMKDAGKTVQVPYTATYTFYAGAG
jgi:hypothetical protein